MWSIPCEMYSNSSKKSEDIANVISGYCDNEIGGNEPSNAKNDNENNLDENSEADKRTDKLEDLQKFEDNTLDVKTNCIDGSNDKINEQKQYENAMKKSCETFCDDPDIDRPPVEKLTINENLLEDSKETVEHYKKQIETDTNDDSCVYKMTGTSTAMGSRIGDDHSHGINADHTNNQPAFHHGGSSSLPLLPPSHSPSLLITTNTSHSPHNNPPATPNMFHNHQMSQHIHHPHHLFGSAASMHQGAAATHPNAYFNGSHSAFSAEHWFWEQHRQNQQVSIMGICMLS